MNVLINEQGELLEILQEEKEPLEGQQIALLSNYYDVFNIDRYDKAIWDFEQNKWVGHGEQRPEPLPPQPTVDEKITMLEQENLSLMIASAETYETMYQENVNLMLAVAELYETVMNGGVM